MKSSSRKKAKLPTNLTREEVFQKMQASSEKMLEALQSAYLAGMKEGFDHDEEDQVLELLQKTKKLRDEVRKIASQKPT